MAIARVLAAVAVMTPAGLARAQPPSSAAEAGPVAATVELGFYSATGIGVVLDSGPVSVHAAAGVVPLAVASKPGGDGDPALDLFLAFQAGADLSVYPVATSTGGRLGVTAGYRFNGKLGHGLAVGGAARLPLQPRLQLHVFVGALWFPSGEDRLIDDGEFAADDEFQFPGPTLQGGATVALSYAL